MMLHVKNAIHSLEQSEELRNCKGIKYSVYLSYILLSFKH